MKKLTILLLSALLLVGCSSGKSGDYRRVNAAEAQKIMETEKNYLILDVRRPDEFAGGHIPGAINIPNETIGSEEIPLLPDKGQLVLVYCRSGNRSRQAAEKLVKLGYTNIVEFGGVNAWPGALVKE